ncbi:unnamed protein product [marine sediment metagenome]|uniref:Uncharacterized protein n=1 Tax=marine sediment metagenome TaxID=412755 RepID=X1H953_9ZZZZ
MKEKIDLVLNSLKKSIKMERLGLISEEELKKDKDKARRRLGYKPLNKI